MLNNYFYRMVRRLMAGLVMLALLIFLATATNRCQGWEPSPDFLRYMKQVEGYRSRPYESVEGGSRTVGYGHKLKPGEAFTVLSEQEATELLKRDLKAAYAIACRQLGYVPHGTQAEIAVDFTFNGCPPRRFPKFFAALKRDDRNGMRREYKRYCQGRELRGRNTAFAERYL